MTENQKLIGTKNIIDDYENNRVVVSNVIFNDTLFVNIILNESDFTQLEFNDCEFIDVNIDQHINFDIVYFENCKISELITFSFNKDFVLMIGGKETKVERLTINSSSELELNIYEGYFDEISIDEAIKEITILGGEIKHLMISDILSIKKDTNRRVKYEKVNITSDKISDLKNEIRIGVLKLFSNNIENLFLQHLSIREFQVNCIVEKKSIFTLENISVDFFTINGLRNYGKFQINQLKTNEPNSLIEIIDSDFNDTIFRGCEFMNFGMIKISSSNLSTLKLYNTSFPLDMNGEENNLYEIYNDLYTSSLIRNNTKDKVNYYKATQENLLKVKLSESGSRERVSSVFALKFSKWMSDFGTDWLKVIGRVLIISIPSYSFLLLSLSNSEIDLSPDSILSTISAFFLFINPLRGADFVNGLGAFSSLSIIIDFFYRIFIAVAIFELIRSFRKYVRK